MVSVESSVPDGFLLIMEVWPSVMPTYCYKHFLKNKSERPVDALAVKNIYHSLTDSVTDNFKSRDASASNLKIDSARFE